jgi:hypothetical protein
MLLTPCFRSRKNTTTFFLKRSRIEGRIKNRIPIQLAALSYPDSRSDPDPILSPFRSRFVA